MKKDFPLINKKEEIVKLHKVDLGDQRQDKMEASKQPEFKITPVVKEEIIKIVDERIREVHVTRDDFLELKAIVKKLAQAQKAAEARLTRLEHTVAELAQAQKRTEATVAELAEAQKKTEEEIRKLTEGLNNLRGDVGGLARSFGYALENEAYRMLPKILKEKYSIELIEKLIRTEIENVEVNIIGFGRRNGVDVAVVGEAKTRIERLKVFDDLEEKVKVVKEKYPGKEIVKVLVTHFATQNVLKVAEDTQVIVVQSFEW